MSGITAAIGYGLGSLMSTAIRGFTRDEPAARTKRRAWRVLVVVSVLLIALFLYLGNQWQQVVRGLQDLDPLTPNEWLGIILVAAIVFYLVLIVSRVIRGATIGLISVASRFLSPGWARSVGVVASVVVFSFLAFGWLLDGVYDVFDSISAVRAAGHPARSGRADHAVAVGQSGFSSALGHTRLEGKGVRGNRPHGRGNNRGNGSAGNRADPCVCRAPVCRLTRRPCRRGDARVRPNGRV